MSTITHWYGAPCGDPWTVRGPWWGIPSGKDEIIGVSGNSGRASAVHIWLSCLVVNFSGPALVVSQLILMLCVHLLEGRLSWTASSRIPVNSLCSNLGFRALKFLASVFYIVTRPSVHHENLLEGLWPVGVGICFRGWISRGWFVLSLCPPSFVT